MKRLQTICAVMAMMAIVGAVHANAGTIEAEANDGEHTENGSFINSSATTLKVGVGSEPYGDGRNAVINFKLPDLGAVSNPFTSATLTVNLESLTSVDGFSFNVDLYAFPPRPGFNLPVLGTLVYYESDPPDPTPGMTLIQTDLITGGSGAAVGLYSTGAAGSSNLLSYLNAQYAGGSGIGEFVFFRLNPDADNGSIVESYNLTSADGSIAANRPTITFTTTTYQEAAAMKLVEAVDTINLLDPDSLKNRKLKKPLTQKINEVLAKIDEGLYEQALNKLQHDILQKTNGCAETSSPDKNDWITDCDAQNQLYPLIIEAIEFLEMLI